MTMENAMILDNVYVMKVTTQTLIVVLVLSTITRSPHATVSNY